MEKYILNFEPVSDRICRLQIKGKPYNTTIINVYAPTEEMEDQVKEMFYVQLQMTMDRCHKHDMLYY